MRFTKKHSEQAAATADSESPGKVDWLTGVTSVDADKLFALKSTQDALDQIKRIEDAAGRNNDANDST